MQKIPPLDQLKGRTIGRILNKMGVLTREQVHHCLSIQKQRPQHVLIGQIFLELGLVTKTQLTIALAGQRGMEYVDLVEVEIPAEVIKQVPAQMAKTYRIIPVEFNAGKKRTYCRYGQSRIISGRQTT